MHTRKVQKVSKETYEEIRGFVVKHPDVETAFVAKHYGLCETLINYARRMTWTEFLAFKEERRQQYHQRKRRQAEDADRAEEKPEAVQLLLSDAQPEMDDGPDDDSASRYTLNAYQHDAARTISATDLEDMVAHALFGMAAEVGELHSLHQKLYQGHPFDRQHAMRELGDILWMLAEYATAMKWDLGEVAEVNIEKLRQRYPDGFNAENSLHRRPGDV